jgi:nucleoside 2-deoxyribosyltransferase
VGGAEVGVICAPRVYIASPIFTPEDRGKVGEVAGMLEQLSYITYCPHRDGIMLDKDAPSSAREEVFQSNVRAIRRADVMLAILDVKDTGTIWELGFAMGANIPIVALTLSSARMNVMLERGVLCHLTQRHELENVMTALRGYLLYGAKWNEGLMSGEDATLDNLRNHYRFRGETQ